MNTTYYDNSIIEFVTEPVFGNGKDFIHAYKKEGYHCDQTAINMLEHRDFTFRVQIPNARIKIGIFSPWKFGYRGTVFYELMLNKAKRSGVKACLYDLAARLPFELKWLKDEQEIIVAMNQIRLSDGKEYVFAVSRSGSYIKIKGQEMGFDKDCDSNQLFAYWLNS